MIQGTTRIGSLSLRLMIFTGLWISAVLLLTGWALVSLFNQHSDQQYHRELELHITQLIASLEIDEQGELYLEQTLSDPRFNQPYSGLYWQVNQNDGTPLLRSRSLWDQVLEGTGLGIPGTHQVYQGNKLAGYELMIMEKNIEFNHSTIQLLVALNQDTVVASRRAFQRTLTLAFGALLLLILVSTLYQIRQSLKPLTTLRYALNQVQRGETRQLNGQFPSEIQPLVDEFNHTLAHDTDMLVRARTQAGNLAHALKTPLSIMAQAAETQDPTLSTIVQEQIEQAQRQIHYHLAHTRAAASVHIPGIRTAVAPVVEALIRTMYTLYRDKNLSIKFQHDDEPWFKGEMQDLQEIIGNLLDNACKWANTSVSIKVEQEAPDYLTIQVADDGPGLHNQYYKQALERGQRMDETVTGSGIGLFIVQNLCHLYGGTLTLEASPTGGLCVIIRLPRSLAPSTQPSSPQK